MLAGLRRGDTGSAVVRDDCPAPVAWDLISDVTRIPEWSAECFRVRWQGSSTEARLGAKFRGWNRNRTAIWPTTCRVDDSPRLHRLAFTVVTASLQQNIEPGLERVKATLESRTD